MQAITNRQAGPQTGISSFFPEALTPGRCYILSLKTAPDYVDCMAAMAANKNTLNGRVIRHNKYSNYSGAPLLEVCAYLSHSESTLTWAFLE